MIQRLLLSLECARSLMTMWEIQQVQLNLLWPNSRIFHTNLLLFQYTLFLLNLPIYLSLKKTYRCLCFIIHFWSWRLYCPTNLDTKNWITWQDKGGSAYRVLVCSPPPCVILGVEKEMSGDSVCSGARRLCITWRIITGNTITRHPSTSHENTITT